MQPRIHPVLSNNMLPPILRQPLRFGDADQIRALYDLERQIDRMTAEAADHGVPVEDLKLYRVTATWTATHTMEVIAANKAAAIEKAEAEADDIDGGDLDFDVNYYAREVRR